MKIAILKLFNSVLVDQRVDNKPIVFTKEGLIFDSSIPLEDQNSVTRFFRINNLNKTFHKSWRKVKKADIETLVCEQVVHYLTTYGFEALNIQSNSIYIPIEKLKIPKIKTGNFVFTYIKAITKEKLERKIHLMLESGIALKEATIQDLLKIIELLPMAINYSKIKNKEMRVILYTRTTDVPLSPVEYLRVLVYLATGKTLLIKNDKLIKDIKDGDKEKVIQYIKKTEFYKKKLSAIFYRFKPIFLSFKGSPYLNNFINSLRKKAKKFHKAMIKNPINEITNWIRQGKSIDYTAHWIFRNNISIFPKIRVLNTLQYMEKNPYIAFYLIRNGKGYVKDYNKNYDTKLVTTYKNFFMQYVIDSFSNLLGKKIYIPKKVSYALPATEKQFSGNIPIGSSIQINKGLIIGVTWNNVQNYRIDLDLSLLDPSTGKKYGWDGSYRSEDKKILFSGDMTDASKGASEAFNIGKNGIDHPLLVMLNSYNNHYSYKDIKVPFDIFIGDQKKTALKRNYIISSNELLTQQSSTISESERIIGIIIPEEESLRFYFFEASMGSSKRSKLSDTSKKTFQYILDYNTNRISLEEILSKVAIITHDSTEEVDINLDIKNLQKDTFINLLSTKEK